MFLNNLMHEHGMTRAELSAISGVPESTLRDILNGKAQIDHCEAGTLINIADALDTTVDEIVVEYWKTLFAPKASVRKMLHDKNSLAHFYMIADATVLDLDSHNEMDFVCTICRERWIEFFFEQGAFRIALFLLGMIDFIHRKHNMIPDPRFDVYRQTALDRPVYSLRTLENDDCDEFISAKSAAEKNAIPELASFNIFMTEKDIYPDKD